MWKINLKKFEEKKEILRKKKLFVLDSSLRESAVGQLRGQTLENKWEIYQQIKKVGFNDIIVTSFSHMTQVGDTFIRQLAEKGEDFSKFYAFTELIESIDSQTKAPNTEIIPIGMRKMKELGIRNPIIEFDLYYPGIDYNIFTIKKINELFFQRLRWVRSNLSKDSKIFINFRDLPEAISKAPDRVFEVVKHLSFLPPDLRPLGLIFEETSGNNFPEQLGAWTAAIREEMDRSGFHDGHLLVHIHEKWGWAEMSQLECLMNGATGIWSSVCEEGAVIGHACSSVTLLNMIRLGNEHVLKQYNCVELRKAAQEVTRITTGFEPYPKQPLYGERALDLVLDDVMSGSDGEFCMASFFGEEPVMRMTTLASPRMIVERLRKLFGEDSQFTEERAQRMLEVMLEDLKNNRKEEYMSKVGLAILFYRSGGKLTEAMVLAIENEKSTITHGNELTAELRKLWDEWNLQDCVKDDRLDFYAFYHGISRILDVIDVTQQNVP